MDQINLMRDVIGDALADASDAFAEQLGTSAPAAASDPLMAAIQEAAMLALTQSGDPRLADAKLLATFQNWEAVLAATRAKMHARGARPLSDHPVLDLGGN